MNGTTLVQETLSLEGADPCQCLVLYEDAMGHDAAMEICGRLMAHFGSELSFAFSFWTFNELATPVSAHWAAEAVNRADIILLALQGRDPAPEALTWLDACARARTKRDGALAVIVTGPVTASLMIESLLSRMRFIAHRLRMDLLPLVPPLSESGREAPPLPLSPALDQTHEPAGRDHWGLNE
jgi:hypothetical protein